MTAARCPYCHDRLEKPDLPLATCADCGTPFHRLCLEELGRCTTLGCAGAELEPERASPQELLLRALLDLQSYAAHGPIPAEARAEVGHLVSLLDPAEVERVRERARKVRSYDDVVEDRARVRRAVPSAGPWTGPTRRPLSRTAIVILFVWSLAALVLVVSAAMRA